MSLEIGEGLRNHQDGLIQDNTLASYGHLYFDSQIMQKFLLKIV